MQKGLAMWPDDPPRIPTWVYLLGIFVMASCTLLGAVVTVLPEILDRYDTWNAPGIPTPLLDSVQQTATTQQQDAQSTIAALETQVASKSASATTTPRLSIPEATQTSTRIPQPTDVPQPTNVPQPAITPSQPSVDSIPTATTEPYVVEPREIPGTAQNGIRFEAPDDGRYRVDFVEGAYDSWPPFNSAKSLWRTRIQIYVNRPIEWGFRPNVDVEEPVNPDGSVGCWEDEGVSSQEEAEQIAKIRCPRSQVFDLQEGDYLLLVPVDENDAYTYGANQGDVTVDIWLLSP
jgi:hypothetical protein